MIQLGCDQRCGIETITVIPGPIGPAGPQGEPGEDSGGGGGVGTGGIWAVYTFAELKAIPSSPDNRKADVSGEYAPFTGQFRTYMWDNTSGAGESVPDVFTPDDSTGPGRWILMGV